MPNPIKYLLPSHTLDMGGFPVKQPLPTQTIQQWDPFLLLHHTRSEVLNDRPARIQGVGPHPHRGFSPVTFVVEGEIHHRDSRGNSQIAKAGEVQWMHAGAGIVHSERPSENLARNSGTLEIIQLWINSPASRKMIPPQYHYLPADQMPDIQSEDGKVTTRLVAGKYQGWEGKVPTQSELLILWGTAGENGKERFEIPTGFHSMLYLIRGEIMLGGFGLMEAEHLAILQEDTSAVELTFRTPGQFLLLCGKPINEKVTQYGPYVMNTQTEVLQAMRDYQMGKMGILIEDDLK